MTTPTPPDIIPGDSWTLISSGGLGTGIGAIPAGAVVIIDEVLPPFSPGVAQVNENTVTATYAFTDWGYDDSGDLVEMPNSRILAYPESTFRLLFAPSVGG